MNQDFLLMPTPANARRLLRLQKNFNIELPSELQAIAEQDLIDEEAFGSAVFAHDEAKRVISQYLLDCGLRAVFQQNYHPMFTETDLLKTVALTNPASITIFTTRPNAWKSFLEATKLKALIREYHLTGEEIDERRSGVLILDGSASDFEYRFAPFALEFPKTLIFEKKNPTIYMPWPIWAHLLFPTIPHPLYPKVVANIPEAWKSKPLYMFAPFYNVCILPELIIEPEMRELLEDLTIHCRLQQHRATLTLFD